MKTKLTKNEEGHYTLSHHPSGWAIGSTNHEWVATHTGEQIVSKLSKQNCDKIFEVVDVEKLINEADTTHLNQYTSDSHELMFDEGFKMGFNKAMELNKDKLFTLEDVKKAYMDGVSNGHNFGYPAIDHTDRYIQSLQQPTEIDVEIEMECLDPNCDGVDKKGVCIPGDKPKLDSEGCLILKKI